MMARRKFNQFSWLVGLLEGEGSFLNPRCGRNYKPRPYITLTSTDKDVIQQASKQLNNKVSGPYQYTANRKPYWKTQLSGKQALSLMTTMLPYLSSRRKQQVRKVLDAHG